MSPRKIPIPTLSAILFAGLLRVGMAEAAPERITVSQPQREAQAYRFFSHSLRTTFEFDSFRGRSLLDGLIPGLPDQLGPLFLKSKGIEDLTTGNKFGPRLRAAFDAKRLSLSTAWDTLNSRWSALRETVLNTQDGNASAAQVHRFSEDLWDHIDRYSLYLLPDEMEQWTRLYREVDQFSKLLISGQQALTHARGMARTLSAGGSLIDVSLPSNDNPPAIPGKRLQKTYEDGNDLDSERQEEILLRQFNEMIQANAGRTFTRDEIKPSSLNAAKRRSCLRHRAVVLVIPRIEGHFETLSRYSLKAKPRIVSGMIVGWTPHNLTIAVETTGNSTRNISSIVLPSYHIDRIHISESAEDAGER